MIFGQPQRITFTHPRDAGYYTPQMPRVGFMTNIEPFNKIYPRMRAARAMIPPPQADMAPGVASGYTPQPQIPQTTLPTPGGTGRGGFGGAFGSSGGVNPYRIMRDGGIPGIMSAGSNIRSGVQNSGNLIRRLSPGAFPQVNLPAGGQGGLQSMPQQPTAGPVAGWFGRW